jgi:hypothetical protein
MARFLLDDVPVSMPSFGIVKHGCVDMADSNIVVLRPAEAGSKGGRKRAERLAPEERSRIAREGALARWSAPGLVPRVLCGSPDRPLRIADIEIPCYVLEDERRVVVQSGMISALGMTKGGSSHRGGTRLAKFVSSQTLGPFASQELIAGTQQPILFRTPSGAIALGFEATILADICDMVLAARKAERLQKQQEHIAERAEILLRAFARVGIVALVDEATGFQEIRARDDLHKILEAYIAKELLPWTKRFPDEFFREMFRVWGWPWPPADLAYRGPQGPRYAGKLVRQLVYEKLPPGVLDRLDEINPPDEKWQRRNRFPQGLTQSIGQPHLDKLVAQITMLFRLSDDPDSFWRQHRRAFPKRGDQIELLP